MPSNDGKRNSWNLRCNYISELETDNYSCNYNYIYNEQYVIESIASI